MSYEKSKNSWIEKVQKFREYLDEYKKPKSNTKEGLKWYNWMNNQKIHYHKKKFHLKHEENQKIWDTLCKEYNLNNSYKKEKIIQIKKKKNFMELLNNIILSLKEKDGILPNSKSEDKYLYNWIRTQKKIIKVVPFY